MSRAGERNQQNTPEHATPPSPAQQSPNIQQLLSMAVQHHSAGELPQAEALYQQVLQADPAHPVALHLLGVIALQVGKADIAVDLIEKSLAIKPDYAEAYNNLGSALKELNKFDQAVDSYRQSLAINPHYAEAQNNLGTALIGLSKFEEAIESYRQAIAIKPDYAEAHFNLGTTLTSVNMLNEAVESYRKAISLLPAHAEAYINLGLALRDLSRLDEAIETFRKAVALKPDSAEAHNHLGAALSMHGNFDEAVSCYDAALEIKPDYAEAHNNLGLSLRSLGKTDEAAASHLKALQLLDEAPQDIIDLVTSIRKSYTSANATISFKDADLMKPEEAVAFSQFNIPSLDFGRTDNWTLDDTKFRIVLLQPPPWRIAAADAPLYPPEEGGPTKDQQLPQDGDSKFVTYGLLSIAAQLISAGHQVVVHNFSTFTWPEVEKIIGNIEADLYGLTCMTYNLRGMGELAKLIRQTYPEAHIVAGGPHPSAQPVESLQRCSAIDTIAIGEGEYTFLEIVEHLENKKPVEGIAGTAWREADKIEIGLPRSQIKELDTLTSPHGYFPTRIFLTSRGCPFICTFCGSPTTWGRSLRFHSEEHVLKSMEDAVRKNGLNFLAVKDDTFSASKKRTMSICRSIIERDLNFIWSCDTRVDTLDEEVLRTMRMAGCQKISLGVESGSPEILESIKKKTSPEKIRKAMQMTRKFGFQVRFYMIIGNRGETLDTYRLSLELMNETKPSEFFFTFLSFYPGTEEFDIYIKEKDIPSDIFYENDFSIMNEGFANDVPQETRKLLTWFNDSLRVSSEHYLSIEEYEAILDRLEGHPAAHMDLAGAYLRAGQPDEAEHHVTSATEKNYPLEGLAHNYLAIIAAFRGDIKSVKDNLQTAVDIYPHAVVLENIQRFQTWIESGGPQNRTPLELRAENYFERVIAQRQPEFPSRIDVPIG